MAMEGCNQCEHLIGCDQTYSGRQRSENNGETGYGDIQLS